MDTLLLSKHEAARVLGISIRSLEYLISRRDILTRRIGRRVLIPRSDLELFVTRESDTDASTASRHKHEDRPAVVGTGDRTYERLSASTTLIQSKPPKGLRDDMQLANSSNQTIEQIEKQYVNGQPDFLCPDEQQRLERAKHWLRQARGESQEPK